MLFFLGRGAVLLNLDNIIPQNSDSHVKIIPNVGVLLDPKVKRSGDEMLLCLSLILSHLNPKLNIRYLSYLDEENLINWDAEKYRINLEK